MPYGKSSCEGNHVTRVPLHRLDSTGEISSESPYLEMIDISSKLKTNQTMPKTNHRVDINNLFNRKCMKSVGNNLTADSSSNSYTLMKDLVENIKSVDSSKSMKADPKDRYQFPFVNNSVAMSWKKTLPTPFHPAIMASPVLGVSMAPLNSCSMSQHAYIPKMTYCNFNRCYQNKFKQKFLKGISCNGNANRPTHTANNQQSRKHCDKIVKAETSINHDSSPKDTPVQPATNETTNINEHTNTVQPAIIEECDICDPEGSIQQNLTNDDEKCDICDDNRQVVNHWSDLCSDDESEVEKAPDVPEHWDEDLEKNSELDEHQMKPQNSDDRESLIAQFEIQSVDNDLEAIKNVQSCDIKLLSGDETLQENSESAPMKIQVNSSSISSKDEDKEKEQKKVDDKSFILFIRKDNKKNKQSAKRRRRSKAKKPEDDSEENSEKPQTENSSPKCQNSAIAFMLGLSPDTANGQSSQPFFMSINDQEDFSDWSEDEDQSDEFSDSELHADEFDMPLNLSVICSLKQPSNSSSECSKQLKDINMAWKIKISRKSSSCSLDENIPKQDKKKVSFAKENNLTEVHHMTNWAEEYQEARKGPWYQYALDNERFQRRIAETEKILTPVLMSEHRNKVYSRLTKLDSH